jgi:hypothetical protein
MIRTLLALLALALIFLIWVGAATLDIDWSAIDWSIFTNAKEEVLSWVGL